MKPPITVLSIRPAIRVNACGWRQRPGRRWQQLCSGFAVGVAAVWQLALPTSYLPSLRAEEPRSPALAEQAWSERSDGLADTSTDLSWRSPGTGAAEFQQASIDPPAAVHRVDRRPAPPVGSPQASIATARQSLRPRLIAPAGSPTPVRPAVVNLSLNAIAVGTGAKTASRPSEETAPLVAVQYTETGDEHNFRLGAPAGIPSILTTQPAQQLDPDAPPLSNPLESPELSEELPPVDVPEASELEPPAVMADEYPLGKSGDTESNRTEEAPGFLRDDAANSSESKLKQEEQALQQLRSAAIADCAQESESCQLTRAEIVEASIQKISLDISPLLITSAADLETLNRDRTHSLERIPSRAWKNRRGQVLAEGQVIDFTNGQLIVREATGQTRRVKVRLLADDDRCFLSAWWRIPNDCQLPDQIYAGRHWIPSTMTWTASALCHKPLYFEEVQLERYGHSQGPVRQTLLSGAHFFGNVFMLPYNVGLHPLNECQYVLGFYRPGDCAPWLIPAFPLHPRAARMQASFVLGGIAILP